MDRAYIHYQISKLAVGPIMEKSLEVKRQVFEISFAHIYRKFNTKHISFQKKLFLCKKVQCQSKNSEKMFFF